MPGDSIHPVSPPARAPDPLGGAYAVLERDFLVFTSRRRFLILRTLVVAIVGFTIVLWPVAQWGWSPDAAPAMVGAEMFNVAAVVIPLMTILVAVPAAVSSVVTERLLLTLPVVLVAPVGPRRFITAKFLSRLGVLGVLVLGTLPAAAACLLFGGIGFAQFVRLILYCAAMAVAGTAAGVLTSTYSRKETTAMSAGAAFTILLPLLGTAAVAWFADDVLKMRGGDALWDGAAWFLWPAVWPEVFRGGETVLDSRVMRLFVGSCVFAVVAIQLAGARLRREGAGGSKRSRRERLCSPAVFEDPVLDRAARGSALRRPSWGALWLSLCVLAICGGALALGAEGNDLDEWWPYVLGLLSTSALLSFCTLLWSSQGIAAERQDGALELLRATTLTPSEIVRAKLGGVAAAVLPHLAIPLLMGIVAAPFTDLLVAAVLVWLVLTVAVLFVTACWGLFLGSRSRSTARAAVRSVAFVIGFLILHALLLLAVGAAANAEEGVMSFLAGGSPLIAVPGLVIVTQEIRNVDGDVLWFVVCALGGTASHLFLALTRLRLARRRLDEETR